jgi:hypothetical protein
MADVNVVIVACLSLVCLLHSSVSSASPSQHGIEVSPDNVAVVVGSTTVLNCASDGVATANIRWTEFVTSEDGVIISDGNTTMSSHPNSDRYALIMPDDRTFSLQISDIVLEDAGYYQCQDTNAAPPSIVRRGAQLVVLEADPNCTQSYPEDGFTIEGQYHTAECTVFFRAASGMAPMMTWFGPEPFTQGSITTNVSVWSGIEFYVERSMSSQNWLLKTNFTTPGSTAPDSATNAPDYEHITPTNQIFVHWPPQNMTATPTKASYEIGEEVTCWADAFPTANYVWQSLRTSEFWYSDKFTTTESMIGYQLMRCTAMNNLDGYDYTRDLFLDVYVNGPTTTTTTTPAPTTTTPPAWAPCGDLTGRWEAANPDAVACLVVDNDNNGLITGLYRNASDTYWLQLTGKTREDKYDELGWAVIWPTTYIGVSSYAAECHSCYGEDILMANAISRTSKDAEFCADGGTVTDSPTYTFHRVPLAWPCSNSLSEMRANIAMSNRGAVAAH